MRGRLLVGGVGVLFMALGVFGVLTHGSATNPLSVGPWVVGLLLGHDLVLAPAIGTVGWLVSQALPPHVRRPVQVGLIVAAVVSVVALPAVLGYGGHGNATVLPLDYRRNLLLVLIAIGLSTLAAVLVAEISRSLSERGPRRPVLRKSRPPAA